MARTIFIILDGCCFDAAAANLGYLEGLTEAGLCARYCVQSELPSLSRPLYETLMTGLPVWRHGVVNNRTVRPSRCENIFSLCRASGLTTTAAAYGWFSELYGSCPFQKNQNRFQFNSGHAIQHGIFYDDDAYPDSHLFADAEYLRSRWSPDFMVVHPMGIDLAGHLYTSEDKRYAWAVNAMDSVISDFLPLWQSEGYQIVVTADHGMAETGKHGGNTPQQRLVPLYLLSPLVKAGDFSESVLSQLVVAPLLCRLLEIAPGSEMDRSGLEEVAFR